MDHQEDIRAWLDEALPEDEIVTRITSLEARASELNREARALRLILQGRRMAFGGPAAPQAGAATRNGRAPGISEGVLRVLRAAPDQTASAKAIFADLELRGWLPDAKNQRKALGATLSRLAERTQQIERVGRGVYRLNEKEDKTDARNDLEIFFEKYANDLIVPEKQRDKE